MPIDYKNGKIYKLWSLSTDDIYIGSTVQSLAKRIGGHRTAYKRYLEGKSDYITSFKILDYGDAKIELIERFECSCKDELLAREGHFIRTLKCVNKCIPGRTNKQYSQDHRERLNAISKQYYQDHREKMLAKATRYNQDNKERINARSKQYYQDNREKIRTRHKQYQQDNKERLRVKSKQYRQDNKERIRIRDKQYKQDNRARSHAVVSCECGSIIQRCSITRHQKSKKHLAFRDRTFP